MTDKVLLVRVHKHVLTLVNAAEKYAVKLGTKEWICKTCNRLSMELKRKKSYHCAQCSFDICLDCMKQLKSPKHEHHLQVTDMLTLADNAMWICHGCGVNGRFQGQYAWRCGSCNYHLCHGCIRDKKCFMHEHDLTKSNPMKVFPEQTSWKCNLCCYVYNHADEEKPYSCRECSPPFAICGTCLSAFLDTEENEKTAAQITLDKENESSSGGLLATYRIVNGQKVESHPGLTSTKGTCKKRNDQVEFTKDSEIQRRSMSADARTRMNGVMEPQKENQRRSSSADATRAIRIKAKRDRNEKRRPASTNEIPIFGRKSKERKLVNCRDSRERRKAVSELEAGGNKSTDVKDKIQSDARSRSRAATTGSGLGLISVVPATADTSTQGKDQRQSDARVRRRAAMAKASPVLMGTGSTAVNINLKLPQKLERNKDVQGTGQNISKEMNGNDENLKINGAPARNQTMSTNVIKQIVEDENVKKSASASKPLAFISYQWNIQDKVLKLREYLEANKIPCWIDIGNMGGGDELKKEIDKGIREAKFIISCVTVAYTESKTCQQEVALADALRKPILPILMEPLSWPPVGSMAMPFAPLIYVDCKETKCGDDFKKVLESIKQRVLVNQL